VNERDLSVSVELSPDNTLATVRFGERNPIVAKVLGVDRENGSVVRVYLDRLIHTTVKTYNLKSWSAWGAISTILEKTPLSQKKVD